MVQYMKYLYPRGLLKKPFTVYAVPRTAPARGANRTLPDIELHLAGAKPHLNLEPVRNTNGLLFQIYQLLA